MVSKRLSIWLREDRTQERIKLWLGAAGALVVSIVSLPALAEAGEVRILKGDGAEVEAPTPEGITVVNRRSKFVFVDPSEFSSAPLDSANDSISERNIIRIGEPQNTETVVYRGGRLYSPAESES